ncbi:flagellar motor protein MotB [Amphibacillus sp. MSJ-3]|uniref:flagellar motor protein MotS n=1 Tax=Amphibacillus sp. MSJ-3 TaxID=2841505 RepID=UPI001C0E9C2D|nr:flagellar motor protein MotS [Amphibacillus sp. MSJ-3]MBU5593687.1 flagellar motor protein MotB [Amphibacillus sp. MSJ-3]
MKLRERKQTQDGSPGWMTTYSDLVTLLLCFFVLLFSMSQIDVARFEAIAESFRNRNILFEGSPSAIDFEFPNNSAAMPDQDDGFDLKKENLFESGEIAKNQESLEELLAEVEGFLEEHQLQDVITANRTDQGVVLILQERILFDTAEAVIKSEGEPFLDKVALLLSNIPNYVRVEGHTDSRPISTEQFPSNWELSGARASSVIRYIINSGDFIEERFISVGYGDTRPIVPNDSSENWQKNRRVEIIILELAQGLN